MTKPSTIFTAFFWIWLAHGCILVISSLGTWGAQAALSWAMTVLDDVSAADRAQFQYLLDVLACMCLSIIPGIVLGLVIIPLALAWRKRRPWALSAIAGMTWLHLLLVMPLLAWLMVLVAEIPQPTPVVDPRLPDTFQHGLEGFNRGTRLAGHIFNAVLFVAVEVFLVWMLRQLHRPDLRTLFNSPPPPPPPDAAAAAVRRGHS